MLDAIKVMLESDYTTEEVDAMTGTVIGHAKSASFRTLDIVGLDTAVHVAKNLYASLPNDEKRETFTLPDVLQKMVDRKLLGDKTKGGIFRKVGEQIKTLNMARFK